jgi:hypothetical protein
MLEDSDTIAEAVTVLTLLLFGALLVTSAVLLLWVELW